MCLGETLFYTPIYAYTKVIYDSRLGVGPSYTYKGLKFKAKL